MPQSSSGSRSTGRLIRVLLDRLIPHPANPNVTDEATREKIAANIQREDDYEPLVVRPHPQRSGYFQVLNGAQRLKVLASLGQLEALCYLWPCDDETALLLLATLNRLHGRDEPLKRAELIQELADLASVAELAKILPESAAGIRQTLSMLDLDLDSLLDELNKEAEPSGGPRAISFVVTKEDEAAIEDAVERVVNTLDGPNRRGRALALICRAYPEKTDA